MNANSASNKAVAVSVAGVLQCIGGGILSLSFLGATLNSASIRDNPVQTLVMACFLGLSLWLFLRGVRNCALSSQARKIDAVMQYKTRERLDLLCQATRLDLNQLVQTLRTMATRGFFPGAYVDLYRREFVLAGGGPAPAVAPGATVLREVQKTSALPVYLFGAVYVIYAMSFPLYRMQDFILAFLLSAVSFFVSWRLLPRRTVIVEEARKVEVVKKEPINTGNGELDEVLTTAMGYMNQLTEVDAAISNGVIDAQVDELVHICKQVFDYISKNPAKVRQLRQFMNYYLPTTIKLLESYVELEREPFKGDNIKAAMEKIETSMNKILDAFRKELDNLYQDKALDISVDIEVLQNMLDQEGPGGKDRP